MTSELQDDVVVWTRKFPNGVESFEQLVRIDCNAPLQDAEGNYWRASWGMMSCWNHASAAEKNADLNHMATHIMDHDASLDANTRNHMTHINKARGMVFSGKYTADNDADQLTMPGCVNHKYIVASSFDVSESWLVDTGCPNDLVSEEQSSKHKD